MPFNPNIDVNSWKLIQWSADVPKLDIQLTELALKLSTWCTNAGAVLAAPAASVADSAMASVISQRTRGYQALGNSTFEVDQRNVNNPIANIAGGTWVCDRWLWMQAAGVTGRATVYSANVSNTTGTIIPGTNFPITKRNLAVQITTSQASLAAADVVGFHQYIEGPNWRELCNDVHSISILVNSTVAPLHFSVALRDNPPTKSLVHLCTVPTANVWTLIPIPGILAFPAGNFSNAPGVPGYNLVVCLASGSTYIAPSADTWVTGNYVAASGTDNFFANPVNSVFYCAFAQHEPGNICTAPQDLSFATNLSQSQRYYQKSYSYPTAVGTVTNLGDVIGLAIAGSTNAQFYTPFKCTMAKVPTVTGYSNVSGAVNNVRDNSAGVDRAISSVSVLGDSSFSGFGLASSNAAAANYSYHYTADTGW